eukprot:6463908-Amphidinium_carterae.1
MSPPRFSPTYAGKIPNYKRPGKHVSPGLVFLLEIIKAMQARGQMCLNTFFCMAGEIKPGCA